MTGNNPLFPEYLGMDLTAYALVALVAVGAVVAEHGATIKDFAGDGVLVLVGAPLAQPDHARVGVEVARKIRAAVRDVARRASSDQHRLGIGVGAASGPVSVGVVGSRVARSRWRCSTCRTASRLPSHEGTPRRNRAPSARDT
ncbi:MAG: hypothetical protein ACT4PK_11570 [Gammaproteobacteria bacterium]